MPFLLAALVGALVGLIARGSFQSLAGLRFRWVWLVILIGAYRALDLLQNDAAPVLGPADTPAFAVQFAAALVFASANLRIPGMPVIGLGAALNLLVVAANGGYMPIPGGLVEQIGGHRALVEMSTHAHVGHYVLSGAQTLLAPLGDVLPLPGPRPVALSPGDVAMMLGLVLAVALGMRRRSPEPAVARS